MYSKVDRTTGTVPVEPAPGPVPVPEAESGRGTGTGSGAGTGSPEPVPVRTAIAPIAHTVRIGCSYINMGLPMGTFNIGKLGTVCPLRAAVYRVYRAEVPSGARGMLYAC